MAKKQRLPARQPRRRPGIERYQSVIEAAECLIVETGSRVGLTLETVAKQAGVPRVSLYYFFESVDALVDTLDQRAVQRMVAELPRPPATTDWQKLLSLYADNVGKFYLNNLLEIILALMPTSHESFHQASQEFGKALYDLLIANGAVPKSQKVARACDIIAGLRGLVWRKSFIETGTLTPAYHREAKRVTIAYMAAVLE